MAESTHSKSNMDCIEDTIAKLTTTQLHLTATQNSMSMKLDDLLQKMASSKLVGLHQHHPWLLPTRSYHLTTRIE